MASVEESLRNELKDEREQLRRQRKLNEQLIARLTANEREKVGLTTEIRRLNALIETLQQKINELSQNNTFIESVQHRASQNPALMESDDESLDSSSSEDDDESSEWSSDGTVVVVDSLERGSQLHRQETTVIIESDVETVSSSLEEHTIVEEPINPLPFDRLKELIEERERWQITVKILIRANFRLCFGLSMANRWGYFVDRDMTTTIQSFSDWVAYPRGPRVMRGHTREVIASSVSQCGYYLFTGGFDKSIIAWDLGRVKPIRQWVAHDESVASLICTSKSLISGSYDRRIKIWDSLNHELQFILEGHSMAVLTLSLNKRGDRLVSGSADKSLRLWSLDTCECLRVWYGHNDHVMAAHLIQDSWLLSGSRDRSIRVWSLDGGSEEKIIKEGIRSHSTDVCVNCDSTLVICLFYGGISVYSWPMMEFVARLDAHSSQGCAHPLNPSVIAVDSFHTNAIQILSLRSLKCIATLKGHRKAVNHLRFTPDGQRLVSVSDDKTVRLWDLTGLVRP